ncbi:hypothetical protein PUN28_000963 [Cardiocondyla obscurior]|uniref:Uncharacterized protein n=1 Tax=Cardiocondyla obscurior TaxID=286306 RepID=A0AAW2H284_9HYME
MAEKKGKDRMKMRPDEATSFTFRKMCSENKTRKKRVLGKSTLLTITLAKFSTRVSVSKAIKSTRKINMFRDKRSSDTAHSD